MHVGVPAQNRPIIGDTGLADGSETTGECGETSLLSIKNQKGAGLNIKSCTRYQTLMSPDIKRCFISMPRQKNQSLKCSDWFASVRKWRLQAPVCMCSIFTAAHSCSVILSRKLFFSHFCDCFTGEGVLLNTISSEGVSSAGFLCLSSEGQSSTHDIILF